jgi:DNA-binding transcriptional ArsR family regulator
MPKQSATLDRVFRGLADPTRRAVLKRLAQGPAPVSDLAKPFSMSLPAFSQHLSVLESSGLIRSRKRGRVRTYSLTPAALKPAEDWLASQRKLWEVRLNQLDAFLTTLQSKDNP